MRYLIVYTILLSCLTVSGMELQQVNETEFKDLVNEGAAFPVNETDKYISVVYSLMNQKLKVLDDDKISFSFFYNDFLKKPIEWTASIGEVKQYIKKVTDGDVIRRNLRVHEIQIIDSYLRFKDNWDLPYLSCAMISLKESIHRFKTNDKWVTFPRDLKTKEECDVYQKLLNFINDSKEKELPENYLNTIICELTQTRSNIANAIENKNITMLRESLKKPITLKDYLKKIKSKED